MSTLISALAYAGVAIALVSLSAPLLAFTNLTIHAIGGF